MKIIRVITSKKADAKKQNKKQVKKVDAPGIHVKEYLGGGQYKLVAEYSDEELKNISVNDLKNVAREFERRLLIHKNMADKS